MAPSDTVHAHPVALSTLVSRLHGVPTPQAGLVVIRSRHGMGRTTLLREIARGYGGPVWWATAAEWEADTPLAVLDQLLRTAEINNDLAEAPSSEATEMFGWPLSESDSDLQPNVELRTPATRLLQLAEGSAQTVLIVIDDAHWADRPSLQSLSTLIRHHPSLPFLAIASTATGDSTVDPVTTRLLQQIWTEEMELLPLDAAHTEKFAAARGIELTPATAERLSRHTGGVVRYIAQLLTEVDPQVWHRFDPDLPAPVEVAAHVRRVLDASDSSVRALVQAICVLGGDTTVQDAALLAGLDRDPLGPLDQALSSGLIVFGTHSPTDIAPADSMVRSAVLDAMGTVSATVARRRAAELIDDPQRRLELLVAATAVPDPELADRLDALATERAAVGAWGAAAGLLRAAGRLTEDRLRRESRLTRAVDALIGSGDVFAASALVPEMESLRETPLRNAALGYLAILRGRPAQAETRLSRAWELVSPDHDPDTAALICQRHVLHALCRCRPRLLVDWADRAIALVGADTPAGVEAAAIRGLGLAYGRMDEARRAYENLTDRVRHGAQVQRIAVGRGWLHLIADELDEARADLESSVPTTYLGGSTRISLWARAWLARAQFLGGDWDDALRTVRDATPLLDHSGIVLSGPLLHWTAAAVHSMRGDWDAAEEAVRHADAGPQDYEIMRVPSALARAHSCEARANSAGVLRALRPLTRSWAWEGIEDPGQWPWADMYAHALIAEGYFDEAEKFLEHHLRRADELGRIGARARLSAARGHLSGALGNLDAAREAFDEALDLLERSPLRYDRARIGFVYGQILRRAGKRRDADAEITAARDIFVAMGAHAYVVRCDRERKAGGVRVPRSGRGADSLTPQEETVAQLVARGLSNREVGAELFIADKTVQYHLTRIYTKLGVRSRTELAARFGPP
ncbi:LuxR C-terminal-related transcriptional regulator [Nocardia sp. NPDC001965]